MHSEEEFSVTTAFSSVASDLSPQRASTETSQGLKKVKRSKDSRVKLGCRLKIMDRISGLPDELLVKILSLLPHKVVISTSILSKRWESLWLWVPKLEFLAYRYESDLPLRDLITKNLSLLKPSVLESFFLGCFCATFQPEDIKQWVETSVSRCVRELDIHYINHLSPFRREPVVLLPNSLYTCKSLVTLKLSGNNMTVDVPRTVDLPCLKTLVLGDVTYSNDDSLRLLLSYCPVLEDLSIDRRGIDNVKTIVIHIKSLLRLTLPIDGAYSCDGYLIVTPSLKYFKVTDYETSYSHFLAHMPEVEEVDLVVDQDVEKLFEAITSVKRLSLSAILNDGDEFVYHSGIVFNQLEHLELRIHQDYWYKLLVRLLEDSPKLRVLKIINNIDLEDEDEDHESPSWNNDDQIAVPKCLLESLETFEFEGYTGRQEERDVVSYILKNARHLKSSSIKE